MRAIVGLACAFAAGLFMGLWAASAVSSVSGAGTPVFFGSVADTAFEFSDFYDSWEST
jgi:hypothetical protein